MTTSACILSTMQEEKVTWVLCPVCHGSGEEGGTCSNCEDMSMIYNIPLEDYELPISENHKELDIEVGE